MTNLSDIQWAYAVPGDTFIIDLENPATGCSAVKGETLDTLRQRYPTAERVRLDDWLERRYAAQNAPLAWLPTTRDRYHEMLNVLPPACWLASGFLVGEPTDHCAKTGRARFAAYRYQSGRHLVANRPMTVLEFETLMRG